MNNTSKIAIGLGLASSALLATWLFTGERKKKTQNYISRKAVELKRTVVKKKNEAFDDSEVHYV
ncbi:MAG: hypothetical protein MUE95_00255 [Cyclobacteriaceae bacterium]|jgi:hypothetical protein|nr:hypothetical protein [Cyclobacteriaceae bacterium]